MQPFWRSVVLTGIVTGAERHPPHGTFWRSVVLTGIVTLDRTLSKDNVFEGYFSGRELWDELCERAESYSYTSEVKLKSGKTVTRTTRNRENAIVGFAVIFKPPAEIIREWDAATREKYFEDCYAVAEELEPELFQPSNTLMKARHKDEKRHGGDEHEHAIGVPLTKSKRKGESVRETSAIKRPQRGLSCCGRILIG